MEMFIGCIPDRIESGRYTATIKYFGRRKFRVKTFTATRYLQEDIDTNNHDIQTNITIANSSFEKINSNLEIMNKDIQHIKKKINIKI